MFQLESIHGFVIASIVLLYWLCQVLFIAYQRNLRHVPGPFLAKFTPLWRYRIIWKGSAHEKYCELHKKYGRIVRIAPKVLAISDPAAIATIYGISSKFLKSEFYSAFSTEFENKPMASMFSTSDPEEHKHLKRAVSQKYSMTSIRNLEYLVDPCSQIFTSAMMDLQGQIVDLGAWVQWYAFDVIGAISFSKRFGFMENRKDVNHVISSIEGGLKYASIVGQMPWLHGWLLGNPTTKSLLTKLTGGAGDPIPIVVKMILDSMEEYDAEAAHKDSRADFLAYLQQQHEKSKSDMTRRDMLNHLENNLLAGSDTTGISLRAVFYYILQNERVYKKLQREIDQAKHKLSPVITYAESLQLEYLQVCLKEAMRMHPGVQYPLERVVPAGGARLCDFDIPTGTVVGMNAAVIHRNQDIFGYDADQFRPERWLDDDEEKVKIMDRHLLTFGAGVRTCIGKNISIMEMGKLVPQVLRQFDIEWASDKPAWQVDTYWFAKQSGLHVRMKSRTSRDELNCT